MKYISKQLFLGVLAGFAIAALPSPPIAPKLAYLAADGGLVVWSQGKTATLDSEPLVPGLLVWSPTGDRVAHVGSQPPAPGEPIEISILELDGKVTRLLLNREKDRRRWRGASGLEWPTQEQLAIVGSIDPSTAIMIVVDPNSGEIETSHWGKFFSYSPSGRNLAAIGWIPHFAPAHVRQRDYVQIDGETVYPASKGSGAGRISPPLLWHPSEASVAFVEHQAKAAFLVVAAADSAPKSFPLAEAFEICAWSSDGRFLLFRVPDENSYLEIAVATGRKSRVVGERFSEAYSAHLETESRQTKLRQLMLPSGAWWPPSLATAQREGSGAHEND